MAGRSFQPLLGALDPGVVTLGISWAPNGSSAVDQTTIKGRGVTSVTRDSAGVFTVALQDVYPTLLAAFATAQLATAADIVAQVGTSTLTANGKAIVVTLLAGAVATDVAADTNNRVNLLLILKNSGV
jgi:hypothetical protein